MKRVLILGDKGVGKTTFLNIFLNKQLPEYEEPTLGVEAGAKTIEFEDRSFVNLQVWDTPGQQEYCEMAYPFYANCKIFALLVDRLRIETLESLPLWLQKIEQHNPDRANNVLILLNRATKINFSNNNKNQFSKKTLEQQYRKQLESFKRKDFHITILQIDLMEEKDQLNKLYLHPYLNQCLTEEIITEKQQKRIDKWGGINCRNDGCEIM